jgi:hypothetical protein
VDDPLIFDSLQAAPAVSVGTSHGGQRHQYKVHVRQLVDDEVIGEAVVRGYLTESGLIQAQTPFEEYVARAVEQAGGSRNDGGKLQKLLDAVKADGGSLYVRPPSDPQDCGQPLRPRAKLPVGLA